MERLTNDVGTLIGEQLETGAIDGKILSNQDFCQQLPGQVVLTKMTASGDRSGEALLVVGVKSAIILGGKLIMLPTEELASRITSANFDGELADAFEEIGNIITGSINAVFQETSSSKLHFIKEQVQLEKVASGPTPALPAISAPHYYQVTAPITIAGEDLGTLWLLIPPTLLDLALPEDLEAGDDASTAAATAPGKAAAATNDASTSPHPPLVLVVADEPQEGGRIAEMISKQNIQTLQLKSQEDLRTPLVGKKVTGGILVLREAGEKGFATAIKLRSALNQTTPLIIAAPEWTKKSVMQAIKYGVCDILMTPVSEKDIHEKLQKHVLKDQT